MSGKESKAQADISKTLYKFLKDQINNVIDNRRKDNREEDKTDESKTVKNFVAILKNIKNDERTTKPLIIRTRGSNTNLYSLIKKLINVRKTVLNKDNGLEEVFNIFDEIDDSRYKLRKHNPRTSNMINRKK